MQIAVFHNLPSGGAKRALYEFVSRLSGCHDFDVFTLSSADHGFADLRNFTRAHRVHGFAPLPLAPSPFGRINNGSRIVDLLRLKAIGRSISREIERAGYDVVLVTQCRYENSPSVLSGIRKAATVFYCQEALRKHYEAGPARPYEKDHALWRHLLDRLDPLPGLYSSVVMRRDLRNIRQADRVLVNSRFSQSSLNRAYGIEPSVSYLGVDVEKFHPLSSRKERFVLSVGSLTPLKGFDFLVESLSRIEGERRPPLVIVSNFQNPPERDYMLQLARDLSVDLRLLSNISEDRLVELYNQAAVVVYAPIREPFGFIPLEAMACATPVVAVREGGIPETVIDGKTGVLVDRDPERFAQAVESLLDDADRSAEMGRCGRQHVEEHWTWERAVASLERHLSNGRRMNGGRSLD